MENLVKAGKQLKEKAEKEKEKSNEEVCCRQIKNKGRHCTKSGIYWNLLESFLLIVSNNLKDITSFIDDETSHLMVFAATN